jgi:hypothetical protein
MATAEERRVRALDLRVAHRAALKPNAFAAVAQPPPAPQVVVATRDARVLVLEQPSAVDPGCARHALRGPSVRIAKQRD